MCSFCQTTKPSLTQYWELGWVPWYPETISVQIELVARLELVLKPQVSTLGDAFPDARSVSLPWRSGTTGAAVQLYFATIRHQAIPLLSSDKTIYATVVIMSLVIKASFLKTLFMIIQIRDIYLCKEIILLLCISETDIILHNNFNSVEGRVLTKNDCC